jgi:hypothetical protein
VCSSKHDTQDKKLNKIERVILTMPSPFPAIGLYP